MESQAVFKPKLEPKKFLLNRSLAGDEAAGTRDPLRPSIRRAGRGGQAEADLRQPPLPRVRPKSESEPGRQFNWTFLA